MYANTGLGLGSELFIPELRSNRPLLRYLADPRGPSTSHPVPPWLNGMGIKIFWTIEDVMSNQLESWMMAVMVVVATAEEGGISLEGNGMLDGDQHAEGGQNAQKDARKLNDSPIRFTVILWLEVVIWLASAWDHHKLGILFLIYLLTLDARFCNDKGNGPGLRLCAHAENSASMPHVLKYGSVTMITTIQVEQNRGNTYTIFVYRHTYTTPTIELNDRHPVNSRACLSSCQGPINHSLKTRLLLDDRI
ncbi:uncharacterized protein EV420DRAFT_1485502 [Desarmillaria tabescens]|uniref:Uncharacterized protein n=1 Tax=Armillaria tabescens TaxID=1929756 RepID=A0AA39JHA9_ARMTA|nr:uncharacterized protein EV420DRAFT_1485502 [Desarmillaria tabescens]KAK0441761.1 hypothetical protein EV420DRAFT_1485502 [Desarmillaria tabescens]